MKSKRLRGMTWGAVLVAAGLTASSPGVSGAEDAPPPTGEHREVTLITGDKVVLLGDEVSALVAAPGRERTVFHSYRRDGHLHVVPRDAAKAVSQGKLDPRLFDVTGLVEAGYDDRNRDTVPLIVTGEREPATAGLRVGHELPAVGSYAAQVVKSEASDTWHTLAVEGERAQGVAGRVAPTEPGPLHRADRRAGRVAGRATPARA